MRLVSLTLHNYRKFKHSSIQFPDGVTGLLGANGAGKSTIIEAIGWAIYGNKAARTTREYIKRDGSPPHDECSVQLQFQIGDNHYDVTRQLSGKTQTGEATVTMNGTLMASSSTETTRYLEDALGMDHDSFFTALIAKQKELNALSDKTLGERKKIVMRMLKIDAVDDAIRHAREDRRDLENQISGLQMGLKNLDELQGTLRTARENHTRLSGELKDLDKELEQLKQNVLELKKAKDDHRGRFETHTKLEKNLALATEGMKQRKEYLDGKVKEQNEIQGKQAVIAVLEPQVQEYTTVLERKKSLEKIREKYQQKQRIQEDITSLETEIQGITRDIKREQQKLGEIEGAGEQLKNILTRKTILEDEKEKIDKEINLAKPRIDMLDKQIKDLEAEKKKIQDLGPESSCPTCMRPLGEQYSSLIDDFSHKINEKEKERAGWRETLQTATSQRTKCIEEITKVTVTETTLKNKVIEEVKLSQDIKHLKERKKEKEDKNEEFKKKLAELADIIFDTGIYTQVCDQEEKLRELKEKYAILQNEIKRLPILQKDIHQLQKDIEALQETQKNILQEIKNLGFNKETYEITNRRYEEQREKMNEKEKKKVQVTSDLNQYSREKTRIIQELTEHKKQKKNIHEIRQRVTRLATLAGDRETGLLNDFKRYLISRISPLLSQYGSQLFAIFTNGKYNTLEIDDNYEIYIYEDGARFPLSRFSGGESDLANLSLRLAISQVVAQRTGNMESQFIALDEIFGSQDSERKMNVLNALHGLSHQFRQILLITHIDDVKDSMEHIITVHEGDDGISYVEMI